MTLIIDDYVKSERFLEKLKDKSNWETDVQAGWWLGWWKEKPRNIWEELIQGIWQTYPNITNISGFEWWTNTHEGDGLGWHQDKDEARAEKDNRLIFPEQGSIYYPCPHDIKGGMLEVDYDGDHSESVGPVYNRLVMLDPSRMHRVTTVYSGKRYAFICNVWRDHVPDL